MKQYRKKPVIVEAVQWTGQPIEEMPEWFCKKATDITVSRGILQFLWPREGRRFMNKSDWFVLEEGHIDIYSNYGPRGFDATYEAVEE